MFKKSFDDKMRQLMIKGLFVFLSFDHPLKSAVQDVFGKLEEYNWLD